MLLQNTLNSFKIQLNKESTLTILCEGGTTTQVQFKFNKPYRKRIKEIAV